VIRVVLLKFDFGSCIRNREQAFQANGVEGTVSNSSVRKKGGRVEIVASVSLFWGEPPTQSPFSLLTSSLERSRLLGRLD
jgi:hypothetical protein